MSFGSENWAKWVLNEDQALPLLKAAWDAGIQTWDTADGYSNGISELLIGKAIAKYSIPREKLVILTKCFGLLDDDPYAGRMHPDKVKLKEYVNKQGLSRKHIFEAVEASLKRLGTDYIDLFQIHRYDYKTPREETMKALHDLVEMGKVHYIGASSMFAYQFLGLQHVAEINGWTKFISMQNYYNLVYREEEREMLPACKELGVGVIPWSPIARGLLARPVGQSTLRTETDGFMRVLFSKEMQASEAEIINRVESIANKRGISMAQVSTAWLLSKDGILWPFANNLLIEAVTAPIVGLNSVDRMRDMVAAINLELTGDEISYLEEPYVPREVTGIEIPPVNQGEGKR